MLRGKAVAALCVRIALLGKAGAEAVLRVRVALRGNLRVRDYRGKAGAEAALRVRIFLHGTAGAETAPRVRVHQHCTWWLAEEGLCVKTCIQFPQRGRAFYSKNSDNFLGSRCASECVSSFSIPRKTSCYKLYIQSS